MRPASLRCNLLAAAYRAYQGQVVSAGAAAIFGVRQQVREAGLQVREVGLQGWEVGAGVDPSAEIKVYTGRAWREAVAAWLYRPSGALARAFWRSHEILYRLLCKTL